MNITGHPPLTLGGKQGRHQGITPQPSAHIEIGGTIVEETRDQTGKKSQTPAMAAWSNARLKRGCKACS
jgi:hypothetical protein